MSLLIVQLGDVHISVQTDPIFSRVTHLAHCILREADKDTDHVLFLLTGDFTQRATEAEFAASESFLQQVITAVGDQLRLQPMVVSIPGNHDLDLSNDQAARDKILATLHESEIESPSILEQILAPLKNYFAFSERIHQRVNFAWAASPFFNRCEFTVKGRCIVLQLLNTAWMSQRHEKANSLLFPTERITTPATNQHLEPYVITLMHHPLNWFRQPDFMRPLLSRLEATSDVIITAHEHAQDAYQKRRGSHEPNVMQIEGGVLQERGDSSISSFNVMKINFAETTYVRRGYKFEDSAYLSKDSSTPQPLPQNRSIHKALISPTEDYIDFLCNIDLPIRADKNRGFSHKELFTYPDLRERSTDTTDKPWVRIKSSAVSADLRNGRHSLIACDARGGKTSLGKQLCLDAIADNSIGVFLRCEEAKSLASANAMRSWIERQVDAQFGKDAFDKMTQNELPNRFVFVDNLHLLQKNSTQAALFIEELNRHFATICATVDTDFMLDEPRWQGAGNGTLGAMRKIQICEFGYLKIEDLTRRWLAASSGDVVEEPAVQRVCAMIERVLRINAMAHYPWVVIVLLQEATSDTELAAKNGSYGFLYQAIVTSALAKSKVQLDIKSKYTYLSELAFAMYSQRVGTFDQSQWTAFNKYHHDKFRIPIDYSGLSTDLQQVGILRGTAGQLSFRDKYSYWFFVSWYLSQHIYEPDVFNVVGRLCDELHHEDSKNILVFLSHFSDHPGVIDSILAKARGMLSTYAPAELDVKSDLAVLRLVNADELRLRLPATDPEQNRRKLLEMRDEQLANRDPKETDGREVSPAAPEPPMDEFHRLLAEIRAAMRAVDILGQILRNGVGGILFTRKREIVGEVYALARRLNGLCIHRLPEDIERWTSALNERFQEQYVADTIADRMQRITSHIVGSLSFLTYALARRVSHALAHEKLEEVFDDVLKSNQNFPSRMFDLSCRLDLISGIPVNRAGDLFDALDGNVVGRNVVRALVGNYLYLHRVDFREHQQVCKRLGIDYGEEKDKLNVEVKKLRHVASAGSNTNARKRKEKRQKRKKRR